MEELREYAKKVKKEMIEKQLKSGKYKDLLKEKEDNEKKGVKYDMEDMCCICMQDFKPDTEVKVTKCKHYFHQDCLFSWVDTKLEKPDCPFCRTPFKIKI